MYRRSGPLGIAYESVLLMVHLQKTKQNKPGVELDLIMEASIVFSFSKWLEGERRQREDEQMDE